MDLLASSNLHSVTVGRIHQVDDLQVLLPVRTNEEIVRAPIDDYLNFICSRCVERKIYDRLWSLKFYYISSLFKECAVAFKQRTASGSQVSYQSFAILLLMIAQPLAFETYPGRPSDTKR